MADGGVQPQSGGATAGTRRSREGLFRYLVALQVLTKLVSFAFNTWCIGAVEGFSGSMLQVTSFVDRVLYYREGFRRGCLHGDGGFVMGAVLSLLSDRGYDQITQKDSGKDPDETMADESTTKLLKVARMAFPIGIVATTVGCFHELWKQKIKLSDPSSAALFSFQDPYVQAILISGFACILDLLAEPLYILSHNLFLLKLRLISEVVATLMHCITADMLIKNFNMEMVLVFPLSQAMYGACLLFAYWFYFFSCHGSKLHCIFPCRFSMMRCIRMITRRVHGWMDYDRKLWQTCLLFTGQSIKELVIQKGQELVPFSSSYLDEYGVVDRLGSLIVRLIFRPFEESNRLKFVEVASAIYLHPARSNQTTSGEGDSMYLLESSRAEPRDTPCPKSSPFDLSQTDV
ncbi:hypothetical protein ACP70R_015865 [Stipagrostis hirtigluma subsp. patula]